MRHTLAITILLLVTGLIGGCTPSRTSATGLRAPAKLTLLSNEHLLMPGNVTTALSNPKSGDVYILQGPGTFSSSALNWSGITGVTVCSLDVWDSVKHAVDHSKVLVTGNPWTKSATKSLPTVLDFGSVRRGITAEKAHGLTIAGLQVKGGGIRPQNTNNWLLENLVLTDSRYAGVELDGNTPANTVAGLAGRATGGKLNHVVAYHNACSGFNLSWQNGMSFYDIYSIGNNYGVPFDPDPGNTRQHNGLWYAYVQNAGGGGKWAGCSIKGQWYGAWDNTGINQWYDVTDLNCQIDYIVCLDPKWVDNSYDATNIQIEISGPNIVYNHGYVRGGDAGTNVCESNGVVFNDFVYDHQGANHRNLNNSDGSLRNGGVFDVLYTGTKFYGGDFGWWGNMPIAYRSAKNIKDTGTLRLTGNAPQFAWTPNTGNVVTTQPQEPTSPKGTSGSKVVDNAHTVYQITNGQIAVNGLVDSRTSGVTLLYWDGQKVYQTAFDQWWYLDANGNWVTTTDPRTTTVPPVKTIKSININFSDGTVQTVQP